MESTIEYTLNLEADVRSAAKARHFVRGLIDRSDAGVDITLVVLLVSELVSNAVMHGGPYESHHVQIELSVTMAADALRVAVRDANATPPVVRDRDSDRSTGRGMQLIEACATAWGVDMLPFGKSVWFTLAMKENASEV